MEAYTKEELTALYRRQVGMVYQICLMLLKNVPDAEDACQTVFQKAAERAEPFRDPEHEKAWLIVTARNECKNQLKHWWRTRRSGPEELERLTWQQPEDGEVWALLLSLPQKSGWPSISTIIRAIPPRRPPASWAVSPPPSVPGSFGGETG